MGMDGSDRAGDDRTFRVNFSGEGAGRLRERVKEKLKEFMGDYTDDTLVEYVIVLLRNGRRKDEARKELNVFLGDDSNSFISWLWDHLSSSLHLYVQPKESIPEEGAMTKVTLAEQSERNSSQPEHASGNIQSDFDGREKPAKSSRDRRNREWKGLVHDEPEPPLLRSSQVENFVSVEKPLWKRSPIQRSPSPRPQIHKKRSRQDERNTTKRDVTSKVVLAAPSRLLQFAVRDAVKTAQQTTLRSEPASKRLRSVVSTSTMESALSESPQRTRSLLRVAGAVATAIKAAAEAAEDVTKVKNSGNVFDRLGHRMDKADTINQTSEYRAPMLEDGELFEDFDQIAVSKRLDCLQRNEYDRESAGDIMMLDRETGIVSDYGSDDDRYDDINIIRHKPTDGPQSASSAPQEKDSTVMQYSVTQNEVVKKTRMKDQEPPLTAATNASRKILNISVNVNTWKPPQYEAPRDNKDVGNQAGVEKSEPSTGKLDIQFPKGNNTTLVENDDGMNHSSAQKDTQKPVMSAPVSYPTGRPSEDADSRTVFVSNVHFAATKDTLSRHFNKFGEVLKVVIITDAATGQPKGSAYVEFLRKESAELALSLNNTSFMSRILRVVRRSSAHHEAAPMMSWPRIARASPFASRLSRMPFPRGIMASAFRARPQIKPGARSLQWKRDAPATPTIDGTKNLLNAPSSGNNILTPTGRNLTYVRTEPKPDANSAPA